MGVLITVTGANYSSDLDVALFDVFSNHVQNVVYDGTTLAFENVGYSGLFETLGSTVIKKAAITQPSSSEVPLPAAVVGLLDDNNYAVWYFTGTGEVRKFYKDGHVDPVLLATSTEKPGIPIGSAYTLEVMSDRVRVTAMIDDSHADLMFSEVPGLAKPMIGVLGTGSDSIVYPFSKIL